MNPYVGFLAIALPITGLIITGVYIKFRGGLATRIFAVVLPTIIAAGFAGLMAGLKGGSMNDHGMAGLIMGPASFIALFSLYRMVVVNFEAITADILASAAQIAATAQESAVTATEQAATVAQVSATVEEINQTSSVAATSAEEVENVTTAALSKGQQGVEAVGEATKILELISQVTEIVESVNDLADQSNLLAVNAGIEAAKAGEHGRGFTVVAAEVRNLAEQSKRSTQRIRSALSRAEEGRRAIESVRLIIDDLANVLEDNSTRARRISATSNQQAAGIRQISDAMVSVAEGGRNTAETARQLEDAVQSLHGLADRLRKQITG